MQSIAVNNEKSLKGDRPNLSINTNLPRKKKSWRLFSGRDNSKTKSFSPKLLKHTSLPIPCPPSPPTAISLKPIRNTIAPMFSKNSSNDELLKSADSNSVHSTGSVHNTLKKFHLPQFHKRSNSQQHKSTATVIEERMYTPTAPEPIMPTLVDWSPQEPISPPPWELSPSNNKRHSLMFQVEADYHSDSEIDRLNSSDVSPTTINSSDITLTAVSINSSSSYDDSSSAGTRLKRRSSCPTYDTLSVNSSTSSKTLVENDIIAITEQHTRYMSVLKKYTHPADKKPVFKSCQKVKARAAEAAANGESVHVSNSIYSSFCEESLKYLYIPNVFDPVTREPVLEFSAIKPRKYQLYRKTSWKREAKALLTWHHLLEDKIRKPTPVNHLPKEMSPEKAERYSLTRRFILREFFTTEVNFWNQLYYTKVVFYDALIYSLEKGSPFTKPIDADIFANLFDLMQFSAKLINRLRHFQLGRVKVVFSVPSEMDDKSPNNCENVNCNNVHLGKALVDMTEDLVVFLRCAVDYKENRKHLEASEHNEGFIVYNKKLNSRKETSQFSMKDYLIIPIQRVARYGLLIADLLKHTEPNHPDYENLTRAHQIVTTLASAMNSAQKKKNN